jgi:cytochrome c5
MKNTLLKISALFFICGYFAISCGESNMKKAQSVAVANPVTDLNDVTVELPKAPGSRTFNTYCVICHSASYIQNQPNMSEKQWTAIVTKMQKTFGAPVPDSSIKEIVQYLVTIKGKS